MKAYRIDAYMVRMYHLKDVREVFKDVEQRNGGERGIGMEVAKGGDSGWARPLKSSSCSSGNWTN